MTDKLSIEEVETVLDWAESYVEDFFEHDSNCQECMDEKKSNCEDIEKVRLFISNLMCENERLLTQAKTALNWLDSENGFWNAHAALTEAVNPYKDSEHDA